MDSNFILLKCLEIHWQFVLRELMWPALGYKLVVCCQSIKYLEHDLKQRKCCPKMSLFNIDLDSGITITGTSPICFTSLDEFACLRIQQPYSSALFLKTWCLKVLRCLHCTACLAFSHWNSWITWQKSTEIYINGKFGGISTRLSLSLHLLYI